MMMDLNSWWSVVLAKASNVGKSCGRKPPRLTLAISLSNPVLSTVEAKQHHAGKAYSNEVTVVVLATVSSCDGWRPWDLSFLSAKIEEAAEDIM